MCGEIYMNVKSRKLRESERKERGTTTRHRF
jgi:hypothetical protein